MVLVEVTRKADDPVPNGVALSLADVRALFEGPLLLRAQRVAKLNNIQRTNIFGVPRAVGTHYDYAVKLRQIGLAIPAPEAGCGGCEELDGACDGCAQRLAVELLVEEPFALLMAASKHKTPLAQVEAAELARVDLRRKRKKQRRLLKAAIAGAERT